MTNPSVQTYPDRPERTSGSGNVTKNAISASAAGELRRRGVSWRRAFATVVTATACALMLSACGTSDGTSVSTPGPSGVTGAQSGNSDGSETLRPAPIRSDPFDVEPGFSQAVGTELKAREFGLVVSDGTGDARQVQTRVVTKLPPLEHNPEERNSGAPSGVYPDGFVAPDDLELMVNASKLDGNRSFLAFRTGQNWVDATKALKQMLKENEWGCEQCIPYRAATPTGEVNKVEGAVYLLLMIRGEATMFGIVTRQGPATIISLTFTS